LLEIGADSVPKKRSEVKGNLFSIQRVLPKYPELPIIRLIFCSYRHNARMQDKINQLLAESWLAKIEHFPTLTSTNDRAAEWAKDVDAELPLLVIADEQTAGRGRGGNRWWTGPESLAFSLLFETKSSPLPTQLLSMPEEESEVRADFRLAPPLCGLAAALAVVEAVRPLLDGREIGLHWPNDVFAAGKKLAGVLVEVLPNRKLILGIGVNINNSSTAAPAELQATATSLLDLTQIRHDRFSILLSILTRLRPMLGLAANSPQQLAAAADAVCLQKNRQLRLQWGPTVHYGCCRGIDAAGAIVLETSEGTQSFPAGVVMKS
jgi:BirA family transcriptional regulator, biotin operon repressor / biotin---[acetyl-CoA-carboxylase] ligase